MINLQKIRILINIILILISINLLSKNFGIQNSNFLRFLSIIILTSIIFININFKEFFFGLFKKDLQKRLLLGFIVLVLSYILIISNENQFLWLISIPIYLIGLIIISNSNKSEFSILILCSTLYFILFLVISSVFQLYWIIDQISIYVSNGIGFLSHPITLGSNASGLLILFSFFSLLISIFLFSKNKKQKSFLLHSGFTFFSLIICWLVYILLHSYSIFGSNLETINSTYVLFILNSIVIFIYILKTLVSTTEHYLPDLNFFKRLKTKNKLITIIVFLFLFLFAFILNSYIPGSNFNDSKKVGIYLPGIHVGGVDLPEYGNYGRYAAGFFGAFPQYLEAYNFDVDVFDENITSSILNNYDVLVIINLGETLSNQAKNAIWSFVEEGNSLLVLGDHTDIGGIMNPSNSLLEPVGIKFKFDSAIPIKQHWSSSYTLLNHPINDGIYNNNDLSISVGASLETDVTKSSFPIILGKGGFSDIGNYLNVDRSYLGDYELNPGEQLGNIILAAGAYYGNGRVVVFGDTSSFQNIAFSTSNHLNSNIFSWLTGSDTMASYVMKITISFLFLISGLILTYKYEKKLIILIPFFVCLGLIASVIINPIFISERNISGPIAFVDNSHGERFNDEYYKQDSVTGL